MIGSGGYMSEDVKDIMTRMTQKKWDIASIITDVYSLSQLSKAIERAADVEHALNVVIEYEKFLQI